MFMVYLFGHAATTAPGGRLGVGCLHCTLLHTPSQFAARLVNRTSVRNTVRARVRAQRGGATTTTCTLTVAAVSDRPSLPLLTARMLGTGATCGFGVPRGKEEGGGGVERCCTRAGRRRWCRHRGRHRVGQRHCQRVAAAAAPPQSAARTLGLAGAAQHVLRRQSVRFHVFLSSTADAGFQHVHRS